MIFPYRLIREVYYPIIPVDMVNKGKRVSTTALLDSGATLSIFNNSTGEELGLDIESGEMRIFQGVSAKLIGYVHPVRLEIAGKEVQCNIAFSRQGIFGHFRICFDEPRMICD